MQITTGFAILVSGFAQLQCGLAALKWRIILDLAWFSCLTHLSCLTILRQRLQTYRIERFWRLFAMGTLAILLATRRFLISNHRWYLDSSVSSSPKTPAICIIGFSLKKQDTRETQLFWSAVLSAIFILVTFISRLVRLHRFLSRGTHGCAEWLHGRAQRAFWILFNGLCVEGDICSLTRLLVYRPLFGVGLMIRLAYHLWSSLAVEVCLDNTVLL